MKLYGYWRSGATYRVRIALALKKLDYVYAPVNLLKGEQMSPAFLKISPQALLPAFKNDDGAVLTQSLAVIEYLEETQGGPSLLPAAPVARAQSRRIAYALACEAQPFQNLRMQKYLKSEAGFDDAAMKDWLNRWVLSTMQAADRMIGEAGGDYCVGDAPSLADICLVPQVYAARRYDLDMADLTHLNAVYERCEAHDAFRKAHPDNQPDAVKG